MANGPKPRLPLMVSRDTPSLLRGALDHPHRLVEAARDKDELSFSLQHRNILHNRAPAIGFAPRARPLQPPVGGVLGVVDRSRRAVRPDASADLALKVYDAEYAVFRVDEYGRTIGEPAVPRRGELRLLRAREYREQALARVERVEEDARIFGRGLEGEQGKLRVDSDVETGKRTSAASRSARRADKHAEGNPSVAVLVQVVPGESVVASIRGSSRRGHLEVVQDVVVARGEDEVRRGR